MGGGGNSPFTPITGRATPFGRAVIYDISHRTVLIAASTVTQRSARTRTRKAQIGFIANSDNTGNRCVDRKIHTTRHIPVLTDLVMRPRITRSLDFGASLG